MRAPLLRASFQSFPGEIIVDSFAGGGGASVGIERALGRPVDIAVNHNAAAIAMHQANHPETKHFCQDVWEVSPLEAAGSNRVGLMWLSPDCSHFSRAKGSKPKEQGIRGLAWVAVRWARELGPERAPRVFMLENVQEFADWGPLDGEGYPIPERMGETFRAFLGALSDLGYQCDFQTMVAADYGTPTIRKRLFLVARRDRAMPRFPDPTHGEGRTQSWRPAADVIDWSIPCPSIFERKRPLAEATLRRIAAGIQRYVIDSDDPCVVAQPFLAPVKSWGGGGNGPRSLGEPMRTVTTSKRGEQALVCPIISKHYGGEHPNGRPKAYGADILEPLSTVTARDHHYLTSAFISKLYGTSTGSDARGPLHTVTSGGGKGGGHHAVVQVGLGGRRLHRDEVVAFLVKYYSAGGRAQAQDLSEPLHTVRTRDCFGVVVVRGEEYAITDIGMRMLQPHELYRAQGFPADYEIRPDFKGKPMTKTDQIKLCGNSVCPQVAQALVEANAA